MLNLNQKTIFKAYSQIKDNSEFIMSMEAVLENDDFENTNISTYIIREDLYKENKEMCEADLEEFRQIVEIWSETIPSKEENRLAPKDGQEETIII